MTEIRDDQGGSYRYMTDAHLRQGLSKLFYGNSNRSAVDLFDNIELLKQNAECLGGLIEKLAKYEALAMDMVSGAVAPNLINKRANALLAEGRVAVTNEEEMEFLIEVIDDTTEMRDRLGEALEVVLGHLDQRELEDPRWWLRNALKCINDWKYIRDAGKGKVEITEEEAEKLLAIMRQGL